MNVILIVETFVAFVIAIVIHEWSHALMATILGDSTSASEGRLSLSPRRHMAVIGTIVAIVYSVSGVGLGWGRPISADARRMRINANLGAILVAITGPLVSLIIGIGLAALLTLVPGFHSLAHATNACVPASNGFLQPVGAGQTLQMCLSHNSTQPGYLLRIEQFVFIFAVTNIILALVNIIPLHPLDGYQVLYAILPAPQAVGLRKFEPYMELLLLVLFFVLPKVLQLLANSTFDPGVTIWAYANQIAYHFAPYIANFYRIL